LKSAVSGVQEQGFVWCSLQRCCLFRVLQNTHTVQYLWDFISLLI